MTGNMLSTYQNKVLMTVGINIILAVSLNVATGYLGQLPLGHAGFMAVGAYTCALFTKYCPLPGPVSFVLGLVLVVTAALREVLGSASFAGVEIGFMKNYTIPMLAQIPGGLLMVGLVAAALQAIWPCSLSGVGAAFEAANMKQEAEKQ